MPIGQRQGAVNGGNRLRLATADDLPQIGQQQWAGRGLVNRECCQVVVHGRWGVTTWLAMLLDKHLFQAGGLELLELLELGGVLGDQRVEGAEVGADFLLFDNVSREIDDCFFYDCFRHRKNFSSLHQAEQLVVERIRV